MNFYEKEQAKENKRILFTLQNGKCFYYEDCNSDFVKDNIYPEAAHIVIDSKVNIKKYGKDILGHIDNFVLTCKKCNSRAILNPETLPGIEHIEDIRAKVEERQEEMQQVFDRR